MKNNLGTLAVVAAVTFSTGNAEAGSFHVTTSAGKTVRIASHAQWDKSCAGVPSPVQVTTPPQHGALSTRTEATTITRVERGSERCMGHQIAGNVVYYTPSSGFHGVDEFAYQVTSQSGGLIDNDATVNVR